MDGFAPSDKYGNYKRPAGLMFNNNLTFEFKKELEIKLFIGFTCPWCHRVQIIYNLYNSPKNLSIVFVTPEYEKGRWIFKPPYKNLKTLEDVYNSSNYRTQTRPTVPLMVINKNNCLNIISNESSEILKIIQSNELFTNNSILKVNKSNDKLLKFINNNINNGVYKCGFARNQTAYINASNKLFYSLNKIEIMLQNNSPWICGDKLSFADIYLFPTLIRWELIYQQLFKCTEIDISKFKNIMKWRFNFYNLEGISKTCCEKKWLDDYYKGLFPLNPNQIVPLKPSLEEILSKSLQ